MALAYTVRRRGSVGDMSYRIVDVTLDNAYAAGGYTLDTKQCGFGTNGQILYGVGGVSNGFLLEISAGKLLVRDASGAAGVATPEVANNLAALNALVSRVMLFGIGIG